MAEAKTQGVRQSIYLKAGREDSCRPEEAEKLPGEADMQPGGEPMLPMLCPKRHLHRRGQGRAATDGGTVEPIGDSMHGSSEEPAHALLGCHRPPWRKALGHGRHHTCRRRV